MDINRNNYEAFLLDLLEGRLSAEEQRQLNVFLQDHPEFVVELPDTDLFSLGKHPVLYADRDQLKKEFPVDGTPVSDANFDMYSIARMEGDLSPRQEQEYLAVLEGDESKRKEWQNWQKTVLVPEELSYPSKEVLKKRNPFLTRKIWLGGLSVAATLTLLLLLLRTENMAPGLAESAPSESPSTQVEQAVPRDQAIVARELASENQQPVQATVETRSSENGFEAPRTEPQLARTDHGLTSKNVQESFPPEKFAKETAVETNTQLSTDKIQSRPIRIAGSLSVTSSMVGPVSSDRIEPLPISPVSARANKLPMNEIAEIDRQILFDEFTRENNISLLTVANAGIKGINKLTGSDISLMASRDEEGDVSGFRLKSKRFSISKPLAREE